MSIAGDGNQPEALNKKALVIIKRVREKLTGRDFLNEEMLTVQKQVDLLIQQATSNENLCQCYIGWWVSFLFLDDRRGFVIVISKDFMV